MEADTVRAKKSGWSDSMCNWVICAQCAAEEQAISLVEITKQEYNYSDRIRHMKGETLCQL